VRLFSKLGELGIGSLFQNINKRAPTAKISNNKHPARKTAGKQITNKFQIPIFNDPNRYVHFSIS